MNKNRIVLVLVGIYVLIVHLFLTVSFTLAKGTDFRASDLVEDTQIISDKEDEMTIVWWLPEEFWREVFDNSASHTKEEVDKIMEVLGSYLIVITVDGSMGPFGGIKYKTKDEITRTMKIYDADGKSYSPIKEERIDPDMKNFLMSIKPMFVNMLGPLGENMNFIVFPSKNRKGKRIADPYSDGVFAISLDKRKYNFDLPVASLLPKKVCPICNKELKGTYKYCPWDGAQLKRLSSSPKGK